MLVYGDAECDVTAASKQAAVGERLARARCLPPGIERHAALVSAFIGASELVQALIDSEFRERGLDAHSTLHVAGMNCLSILAHSISRSWRSGFTGEIPPASSLRDLSCYFPSRPLRIKHAEGYAFYALYPESYVEAALRSGLGSRTRVIGIRSIGTGLSALVAAALGAPSPITLRPVGDPFRRMVQVDPALTEKLAADKDSAFAIVDEGPGLSGSSFGAVADWLEAAGVARERIHFFPSHRGDLGPQASEDHQDRWRSAPRHVVEADALILHAQPPHRLAAWVEEVVGPLNGVLENLSGGAWRKKHYRHEKDWPAANVQQERLKFLAHTRDGTWLVKFIGLGEIGLRKYRRARQLNEAGFTPEIAGYRHGFLIERWHEHARTLDQHPADRTDLIKQLGSYLSFRARCCQAGSSRGASLEELRRMACHNARQAMGDDAAEALERNLPEATLLEGAVRRVATDNRMHAWEWLTVGGQIIKTDAADHCAAHDLVGPQDITWDIAGASVELRLTDEETLRLCGTVESDSGIAVSTELLEFMLPCYLAFQLGAQAMAAMAVGQGPEADRLRRAADGYAQRLKQLVCKRAPHLVAGTPEAAGSFVAKADLLTSQG